LTIRTADKHVLDAHALVWFLVGSPKLGANARTVLESPASDLYLPLIALAEACWMVEKGRAPTIPTVSQLLTAVDADRRVTVVPLDRIILELSVSLTSIAEMHDRQIVATALHLATSGPAVALLTRDVNITASGLVPIIW
jgi:PIN domain nuclease of toxin-antitoxin system